MLGDKTDKLLSELQSEQDYGIFLAAQMSGVPGEIQLMVQTARFDETQQGLQPRAQYIIRALNVVEQRMSLGVFGTLFIADEHPLLFHYNEPRFTIHFEGKPKDTFELVLDIQQGYLSTFGPWREIARDLNRQQPLVNLLQSGGGTLGTMPKPAAERMTRIFAHHGMSAHLQEVETYDKDDEHGRSRRMKLMGIDDSYFVALDFSVDEMGKI